MRVARYQSVLTGVGFALMMVGILLSCFAMTAVISAQSTNEPDTTALQPIGVLVFTDSAETLAGAFQLTLSGLAAPPADSHYELWLHSDQTDTLGLGALTVTNGSGTLQGSTDHNLVLYDRASISIEDDEDDDGEISERVVLTATLPKPLHTILAQLLVMTAIPDGGAVSGFIAAAHVQTEIAVQHTGFLRDALGETDLPQARRHSEHIINILDGKDGFMFGDLDRDGRPENPGDGVGVRTYLDEARTVALDLVDLTEAMDELSDQNENAQSIVAAIETGQSTVAGSFDKALQIFASDTVTEALIHAQDLSLIIDDLIAQIAIANTLSLQMATYTFYVPPVTAGAATLTSTQTLSPTRLPITATRILSPTRLSITATAPTTISASLTPTVTAVISASVAEVATPVPTLTTNVSSPTVTAGAVTSPTLDQSWRNPVDGALYVYVAGGEFTMGSTPDTAASPREEPSHTVTVAGFWLQQTETTNAQYGLCVTAEACTPPTNERWNDPAYAEHPVTDVDWQQATAYATWAGGRLPSEAEWESACRGAEGRTFPWGEELPTDTLSNYNNLVGDTMPVGSYPDGATPLGLLDLSGNVWEWVSSLDMDYPYDATDGREDTADPGKRIVRGGSFYYTQYQIRCAARTGFSPDTASQHIGFRVAVTAPVTELRNPVDGALYVYVAGGEFTMGSTPDTAASPREEPSHTVTVVGFWLQQTETTNAQYGLCVTAEACTPPTNERWNDPAYAEHPVTDVDWQQATAYATWAGGRLPSEAEWESACRGAEGRTFPWGEELPTDTLSNYNNLVGDTMPVGSYPDGATPLGLLDLSGNVWEWVSSLDMDYPYDATDGREDAADPGKRIVRGGSFYYTQYQIRCAARTGFSPDTASQHIGFRVVLEKPQ